MIFIQKALDINWNGRNFVYMISLKASKVTIIIKVLLLNPYVSNLPGISLKILIIKSFKDKLNILLI